MFCQKDSVFVLSFDIRTVNKSNIVDREVLDIDESE